MKTYNQISNTRSVNFFLTISFWHFVKHLAFTFCSSWVGIACNNDGTRVVAIHLAGAGLYGSIPSNTIGKLDALRALSLRSNFLHGSLPPDIPSIPSLRSLYLHHNNFSGEIPTSLSSQLHVLDFSFNSFSGNIPATFENLTKLNVLSLQFNSFSGAIPNLNLPSLKLLNLSYNKLNGSVPYWLQNFPVSSFLGNSLLCGPPLTDCSTAPNGGYHTKLGTGSIIALAIGGSSILVILVSVILFFRLWKKDGGNSSLFKVEVSNGERSEKTDDFGSRVLEAKKNKLVFFKGCSNSFEFEDL